MNKDFRVSVSLPTHPKALKLMRRCGDIAFFNLIKFWAFVAQNKPDGFIKNGDPDDIEIAAGWNGQCSEFYQALLDLNFIERVDGGIQVHDWQDHNGYAFHAKERSDKAKKAAEARWNRKNNATSMLQAMPDNATSNAPSPTPSPIPKPNKLNNNGEYTSDFLEFWKLYPKKENKGQAFKAWKKINRPKETLALIQVALLWQRKTEKWTKQNGQFIPMPSTYLNARGWEDEKPEETEPEWIV